MNWLLGEWLSTYTHSAPRLLLIQVVLGPEPFRLGFIGAPIATALCFNLISLASVAYGVYFVPSKAAWHPFSRRSFTSLGVLVQLGLSGVGQVASEWWSWELVGRESYFVPSMALFVFG